MFFCIISGLASARKRIATMTSEPKLSQSERVEDLTSCGLLEKENVWLFSVFFTLLCLWDRDAVLRVCVVDLLVWSRLNFVADFVHVWKLLINRCTQRHVRSDENETEVGTERNRKWCMIEGRVWRVDWLAELCGCGHVDFKDTVAVNAV